MKNLPANTPASAIKDLRDIYIPENTPDTSYLELSIRIADEDLTIRDLSAFLDLVDRIYGRLSEKGLKSYARKEHGHLKINQLRKGSWELILQELITSGYSHALIIVLLSIKYLPSAVDSIASAYNNAEQGLLARENRKRIRAEMDQDDTLSTLNKERKNQLSALVEFLHEKEKEKLHRTIRFVQKRLLSIEVRVKNKEE